MGVGVASTSNHLYLLSCHLYMKRMSAVCGCRLFTSNGNCDPDFLHKSGYTKNGYRKKITRKILLIVICQRIDHTTTPANPMHCRGRYTLTVTDKLTITSTASHGGIRRSTYPNPSQSWEGLCHRFIRQALPMSGNDNVRSISNVLDGQRHDSLTPSPILILLCMVISLYPICSQD